MWYVESFVRILCIIFAICMTIYNILDIKEDLRFYRTSRKNQIISVCLRLLLAFIYDSIVWMLVWLSNIRLHMQR